MQMFNPAHPGEVLKEAYLDPLNMSASEFVNKHAGMSVEMAHRLAQATDTTAESWLMMQVQYALWEAKQANMPQQIQVKRLANGFA